MSKNYTVTKEIAEADVEHEVKDPAMYKVLLHNDDYTTMEFVVYVLMSVFHKPFEEAQTVMLNVHRQGVGLCGIFTYEIAETKVETVIQMARQSGYPLKCSMEKV